MRSEHGDRPGARPAAAVRLRERLVQVEVDDVEAHVAGPRDAHHGVQVGAVVVERRPHLVHDPGDLLDVRSNSPSVFGFVSIRQATSSSAFARRSSRSTPAVGRRADLDHLVAGHRHGGRVGAVRGVRREHLAALLAAVLVVGAREQQAGQLAVRAGARLQRHVRQPGDLGERALEAPHQLERALRVLAGPAAGAGGRGRAAPPRARAASGCASSCTSRAGRSPRRGGSSSTRASCSGARARARRPRAAPRGARGGRCSGSSSSTATSGTSTSGAAPRTPAAPRASARRS